MYILICNKLVKIKKKTKPYNYFTSIHAFNLHLFVVYKYILRLLEVEGVVFGAVVVVGTVGVAVGLVSAVVIVVEARVVCVGLVGNVTYKNDKTD